MKIRELVQKLKQYDEDLEVAINLQSDCYNCDTHLDYDLEVIEVKKIHFNLVIIKGA